MKSFIIEHYLQNGYPLDKLILFGIRNDKNFELDMFNDWLGFIYGDQLHIAKGTTDPGVYYTKNPMNPKGAFHLVNGFHKDIWRLRKHAGKYLALCNDPECEKVRGWRDSNPDFIFSNWVYTNWHYTKQEEFIKMSSAGCQVSKDKKFFKESIKAAQKSGQLRFSYNLFKIEEIPTNLICDYLG